MAQTDPEDGFDQIMVQSWNSVAQQLRTLHNELSGDRARRRERAERAVQNERYEQTRRQQQSIRLEQWEMDNRERLNKGFESTLNATVLADGDGWRKMRDSSLLQGWMVADQLEGNDPGYRRQIIEAKARLKDEWSKRHPETHIDAAADQLTNHVNITYTDQSPALQATLNAFNTAGVPVDLQRVEDAQAFPQNLTVTFEKVQEMRYGENPHQKAAFYRDLGDVAGTLPAAKQLHGKELSYNNINDTNGALERLREFDTTAVIAVKHGNPCGVGVADAVSEAYRLAYEADPVSVFGGIVVTNGTVDAATAEQMSKIFLEIIVAPKFTDEALAILTKKKNLRLLELDTTIRAYPKGERVMRKVAGGLLVQEIDDKLLPEDGELKVVTKAQPTAKQMEDLMLAWKIVKHAKSNGIAIAKDHQSLGIGPGQVNRIWSTQMAIERSGDKVRGAALASDAFFPFDDCVKACAEAGISCIIQPGGSVRDQDSIDACDRYGIAMVFTGMRHFKH